MWCSSSSKSSVAPLRALMRLRRSVCQSLPPLASSYASSAPSSLNFMPAKATCTCQARLHPCRGACNPKEGGRVA